MTDDLDRMLARLRQDTGGPSLQGFETDVLRSIAARRDAASAARALAPVRFASVAMALVMGVAAGGTAVTVAMAKPRFDTFSTSAPLAPSTLLEGHG